jgi:hypothetical protein
VRSGRRGTVAYRLPDPRIGTHLFGQPLEFGRRRRRGAVLAAWGVTTGGKPAFIGLAPGAGESADAWHHFLQDLKDRGLPSPLLVISDGAPGLISAIEQAFPRALRQRCLIHYADLRIMPTWPVKLLVGAVLAA